MKDIAKVFETDVLIVGGGGAGCYAALRARDFSENVLIASKGYVGPGTVSAALGGGISICFPEDDKKLWMEELVERGEYLNDQEWVKIQLEEVYPRAMQLDQWGTSYGLKIFEKDAQGKFIRRKARGNLKTLSSVINGFPLMETLRKKVLESKIPLMERVMVTDLLMKNGRPVGALGFDYRQGEFILFKAKAIVLAGGGCSFKTGGCSPAVANTGEAQFMAYEAGAILRNIDQAMSQSTPKAIEVHGLTLFAGVGGKFLNGLGEEFMLRYDPKVGSRARLTKLVIGMAKEVEAGRGPIYMDMTGTSATDQEMLRRVVPEPMRAFASANIDPFKELIPWSPIIRGTQVHGGGVHIDTRCASNIPGLYVVGDSSCTPEHGTWSITGLNIAFALLSGYRAGEFASQYAKDIASNGDEADIKEQVQKSIARITKPIKRAQGISPDDVVQRIWQIITPYKVSYLRSEEPLIGALKKLAALRDDILPQVSARDSHELVKAAEVRSMVAIAEMILRSVLFRKESRGFVFREDYPLTDNLNWLKWVMVQKDGEHMKVWAEEFPTPYIDPPREIYPPR